MKGSASNWRAFDDHILGLMDRLDLPGMAVAVARDGRLLHASGYGLRDRQQGLPVDTDTVFGIASVTKSFAAAVIMQLVDEGRLAVTDPVKRYLPEFRVGDPDFSDAINVHHFLTHTTGIPPLPTLLGAMARSMQADASISDERQRQVVAETEPIDTPEQMMTFMGRQTVAPLGPPGTVFSYSNDCFGLLGTIAERVTGKPFAQQVQERIVEPLGLSRTGSSLDLLGDNITMLYSRPAGSKTGVEASALWWESPAMVAAGFLRSTVTDLIAYLEIYRCLGRCRGEAILSPTSARAMVTPQFDYMPRVGYGYGLRVQRGYHGLTLVEHSGGLKGISSHILLVPEAGVTAAVLCNVSAAPASQVALAAVNTALGLPLGARRVDYQDYQYGADYLKQLVGSYESGEGFSAPAKVELDADRLKVVVAELELTAHFVGPDSCLLLEDEDDEGTLAMFMRRSSGEVWAVHHGARVWRRLASAD